MKTIITLILTLILSSCASASGQSPIYFKDGNIIEQGPVTIVFDNKTDERISYGQEYHLEKADGTKIEMREGLGWTLELYYVEPGQKSEKETDLSFVYQPLPAGDYKLIYPIFKGKEETKENLELPFTIKESDHQYIEAVVVNDDETNFLLYDEKSVGLFTMSKPTTYKVKVGDVLRIMFDSVMESYPAQVVAISDSKVIQAPNQIVYSRAIIEYIREQDTALSQDIQEVTLNVKGLSEKEIESLRYLLEIDFKVPVYLGDYESLVKEGKILEDKGNYYEKGVLINLDIREKDDYQHEFDADFFRSGLGAIGFKGTINRGIDGVEIKVDNQWIS